MHMLTDLSRKAMRTTECLQSRLKKLVCLLRFSEVRGLKTTRTCRLSRGSRQLVGGLDSLDEERQISPSIGIWDIIIAYLFPSAFL
jgi:hypothetical protein